MKRIFMFLSLFFSFTYGDIREYNLWVKDAEKYNEPLFQDFNNSLNVESYRFVRNVGEDGWKDFWRVTKIGTTITLHYGYMYAYDYLMAQKRDQTVVQVNLKEEEWNKILFSINDMNYTHLNKEDDVHVFDGGFTLFESLKEHKYHYIIRDYPAINTKIRKLEKFVYAQKVIKKIYRKIKKDKSRIKIRNLSFQKK